MIGIGYSNISRVGICLQVIQFVVCYMNLNCQTSSLNYYDGDLRKPPHRYCGLKQLTLPRSNSSVAIIEGPTIIEVDEDSAHSVFAREEEEEKDIFTELKIEFKVVSKNASQPSESPSNLSTYLISLIFSHTQWTKEENRQVTGIISSYITTSLCIQILLP